jgi:hypothetical protein
MYWSLQVSKVPKLGILGSHSLLYVNIGYHLGHHILKYQNIV